MQQHHQQLNIVDRHLLAVNEGLKSIGTSGFWTQAALTLDGRLDLSQLKKRLDDISKLHPSTVAVLVNLETSPPAWNARVRHEIPVLEFDLADSTETAIGEFCGDQLNSFESEDRYLRFCVLHFDRCDVLVMQYNHVLMDNKAATRLLSNFDRPNIVNEAESVTSRGDPIWRFLKKHSKESRRDAFKNAIELWRSEYQSKQTCATRAVNDNRPDFGVCTRVVSEHATNLITETLKKRFGFANLSISILTSAFRALHTLGMMSEEENQQYAAALGVDLNIARKNEEYFQNLLSVIPLRAVILDLVDHPGCCAKLSEQFQSALRNRVDVGILELMAIYARRPTIQKWVIEYFLKQECSLWFAYFAGSDSLDSFSGLKVDDFRYIGPTWRPMALTLLTNRHRGRLFFNITYDKFSIADELADRFLDAVIEDLQAL